MSPRESRQFVQYEDFSLLQFQPRMARERGRREAEEGKKKKTFHAIERDLSKHYQF